MLRLTLYQGKRVEYGYDIDRMDFNVDSFDVDCSAHDVYQTAKIMLPVNLIQFYFSVL